MNLLQELQTILTQQLPTGNTTNTGNTGSTGNTGAAPVAGGFGNLAGLLAPAALGGLMGALMSNKTARSYGKNALLLGGAATIGAALWKKYKGTVGAGAMGQAAQPSSERDRAARLIRALVFAAKSDGQIDAKEQQAMQQNIHQLGIGAEAEQLIQEAIAQPLDPNLLAKDVKTQEEALEVYLISCAAVDIDHFMERSYLDALALALKIPDDVKKGIEAELQSQPAE